MARKPFRLPPHVIKPHGLCEKCNAFGEILEFMVPDTQHYRHSHDARVSFDQMVTDHTYKPFHLCRECSNPLAEAQRKAREVALIEEQMRELAEVLHEARCLGPHEGNGCLFSKETDWKSPSRMEWLRRALKTRRSMSSLSIPEIIRVLKST